MPRLSHCWHRFLRSHNSSRLLSCHKNINDYSTGLGKSRTARPGKKIFSRTFLVNVILLMPEIRHSPVEVGSFIPLFTGLFTSQVVSRISGPSTVSRRRHQKSDIRPFLHAPSPSAGRRFLLQLSLELKVTN